MLKYKTTALVADEESKIYGVALRAQRYRIMQLRIA